MMVQDLTPQFVGRTAELDALRAAFADARAGRPRVVLVEGEPGIGKTALLRRFLRGVGRASTLWASGDEDEIDLDFGVVEQLWAAMPDTIADTRSTTTGTDSLAGGADLLAGIGALERHGAVVMVIDDVHWADSASVRALLFVVRRLQRDHVLLLATARSGTLPRLGEGWARVLSDAPRASVLRLDGLTEAQVRELAAAHDRTLPASAGDRLRDHTGGNPLHVRALLAELPIEALQTGVGDLPAPHSYAATVVTRLARLPEPAQTAVAATSVLGMRAALRSVAAMTDLPEPATAAEHAAEFDLLQLTAGPAGVELSFPHPLVRAAVYDNLPGPLRRRLHRAAVEVVEGTAVLRHRVAAAEGVDEDLARELLEAAEREVAAGAALRAASYLESAAQVDPDPVRADRCMCRAIEALLISGDTQAAAARASRVREGPPSTYRRYVSALLTVTSGDFAGGMAELHAVAESVTPEQDADLFARVAAALGLFHSLLGDDQQTIAWASRAHAIPERTAGVDNLARQAHAWACARAGRMDEALTVLADCSPDRAQPRPFETDLLTVRGVLHVWAGDPDAAIRDLRAVERWVRNGFSVTSIVLVYSALAEAEFRSGAWDNTATHAELAVSLGEGLEFGWYLPYAHQAAAQLYAARGEHDFAVAHAAAARAVANAGSTPETMAYAALAEAEPAWATGDWPAIDVALRRLSEPSGASIAERPNLALWRYRLAEAWIWMGRAGDALDLLDQAPAPPLGGTEPADGARLRALALRLEGDTDGAADMYAVGMASLGGAPTTLPGALLALDYGRFLLGAGQPAAAVAPLRSARAVLDRLGAEAFRPACDGALSECDVTSGSGRTSTTAADTLTARERVVARLVADGATNREVAAQLYLSVKGIEYHLGNIFAKLEITSRRQLRSALGGAAKPAVLHASQS
jgi:ATP/maltotriose-dependent transcriptional regulator MalT